MLDVGYWAWRTGSAIGDSEHDEFDKRQKRPQVSNDDGWLSYLGEGALGKDAAKRISTLMTTREIEDARFRVGSSCPRPCCRPRTTKAAEEGKNLHQQAGLTAGTVANDNKLSADLSHCC